jgi:hypothetical protein
MTDEQHYQLLEKFANEHSIAIGGGIKVHCSSGYTSYTPVNKDIGCKIEDSNFLNDQLKGADSFIYWLRRNGLKIVPELKVKAKRK